LNFYHFTNILFCIIYLLFWKESGEKVKNRLFQIIRDIYATGEMPEDYVKSLIIPIPKKAAAKKCEKFRTISLLSHASKILTKIIFQRIDGGLNRFQKKYGNERSNTGIEYNYSEKDYE